MEYAGAVLDLDGTIYRGSELLPGAAAAVRRLRELGIRPVFFSNNPTKSRSAYADRLSELGIDVGPESVLSAGTVTTRFLADEHGEGAIFLVGDDGLRRQFEAAGLHVVEDATAADVLVVSWTDEFDYGDLLAGYRALNSGATFYGTDPDRLIPAESGMAPGSGAIINAVGGVVGREPAKILGKPSPEARAAALSALDAPPERCLVIGDRLDTDIALGAAAGMTTVLVETGIDAEADIGENRRTPDYVVESLAELEQVLEGL